MYGTFLRRGTALTARLCLVGVMAGSAAHAVVSGSFAFDGNGTTVSVSLASLTFAGANDTIVGSSNLTYGPGILLPVGTLGRIFNIGAVLPVDPFMTENGIPLLDFKLTGLGPGDTTDPHNCSTATSNGQSCSLLLNSPPFPPNTVSPVILTFNNNKTTALLNMSGTVTDGGPITSFWTGQLSATLTAPLNQITNPAGGAVDPTPQNIFTYFQNNPNGAIVTTFSGTITATPVPEPGTTILMGAGLMLVSLGFRRWRKA